MCESKPIAAERGTCIHPKQKPKNKEIVDVFEECCKLWEYWNTLPHAVYDDSDKYCRACVYYKPKFRHEPVEIYRRSRSHA